MGHVEAGGQGVYVRQTIIHFLDHNTFTIYLIYDCVFVVLQQL